MGAEEACHAAMSVHGGHNEHLFRAGVAFLHGNLAAGHAQLVQRPGKGQGLTAKRGARVVRQILARA